MFPYMCVYIRKATYSYLVAWDIWEKATLGRIVSKDLGEVLLRSIFNTWSIG